MSDRWSHQSIIRRGLARPGDSTHHENASPLEDEETFYHTDIVGLPAFGPNDMPVGIVRGLFDFGAGDVMEIEGSAGRSFFVPFTRKDVPIIDIKGRRVGLGHDLHLFSASATDVTTDPIETLGGQRSRSPRPRRTRMGRGAQKSMTQAGKRLSPFSIKVLTLFPDMFPGPLAVSLLGKALNEGIWSLETVDIRGFARDKRRSVDDAPFGGGVGMVMRADVIDTALRSISPVAGVFFISLLGDGF